MAPPTSTFVTTRAAALNIVSGYNCGAPGEVYSLLPDRRNLLLASYTGPTPLAVYEPSDPFSRTNPLPVQLPGQTAWRPVTMVRGPAGQVYLGLPPDFGQVAF